MPPGLYTECTVGSSCDGASQVCLPIRRNGRETGACTLRCVDDSDCPRGICLVTSGTIDDSPRCRERCTTDEDCVDPTFGCETVGIMSTRGSYETQLCNPQ